MIEAVEMFSGDQSSRAVQVGDPVRFQVDIAVNADIDELTVGLLIRDRLGNDVFGTNTWHLAPAANSPVLMSAVEWNLKCRR